ncbi:MAG TPA: YraN family protein [Puia sp.]|jgi:putative endonuclease|nr:YraN family protein [Puia sp.]
MVPHIRTGKRGEELAAEWLIRQGYDILHRNWRHRRWEIDIIAARKDVIHLIEVKSRKSNAYGPPEKSVNRKKIEHLLQAAAGWLLDHPGHTRIQFDVLAITFQKDADPEYFLIEDVYL